MRHMSEPAALDRRNAIVVIILAVCAASIGAAAETAPVQTTEFTFEDLKLKVPAGFTVTRVAGPPLVDRPVSVSFDENGGLYVADSSGSNKPLREQQDDPQHKVLRLEDTDGDGVFDRRTVFADKLMMLQGTQWYRGSLYVAAPPKIWKLTDTNNDGVADERVEWFDGKVPLSCGNDVHGPSIGRDGRLYWCKGEFSPQVHDLPGRPGWKSKAAHVFRARPDGTDREMVMTGGMNNPVELAFTPSGERILSATFISNDMGGGRDGLIHAIYGGVYGREHGVLDGHERTGDLLSPMLSMGAAAPCGTQLLVSRSLGDDLAGNLFVCAFNLRTVFRNVLTSTNGTFTTVSTPFVTGDSSDFHPTDVHEDADGSLLVIDTGGWYKICCPTSRVEKPQVLGAIYRIRRAGAEPVKDPRGLALDWPTIAPLQLAHLLADARPAVAERAGDALACIGVRAVDAIKQFLIDSPSPAARQNAVWALSKIDGPEARTVIRMALTDKAAEVRHAASHVAGLHRDAEAVGALAAVLAGDDAGSSGRAGGDAQGNVAVTRTLVHLRPHRGSAAGAAASRDRLPSSTGGAGRDLQPRPDGFAANGSSTLTRSIAPALRIDRATGARCSLVGRIAAPRLGRIACGQSTSSAQTGGYLRPRGGRRDHRDGCPSHGPTGRRRCDRRGLHRKPWSRDRSDAESGVGRDADSAAGRHAEVLV